MLNPEFKDRVYKPGYEVLIGIGEQIFPFAHPANYRETWFTDGETKTKLRLKIDLQERKSIPLRILSSLRIGERNGIEIVPFHPEKGYIINQDDFDIEKRRKKLLEGIKRYGGFGIDEEFPLHLAISVNADYFVEDGLAIYQDDADRYNQRQEVLYDPFALFVFRSLKCRIYLPGAEFETILNHPPLEKETYNFRKNYGFDDYEFFFEDFYPLETGPLKSEADCTFSMEDDGSDLEVGVGHELYFADNKGEIRKIGLEFVIVP